MNSTTPHRNRATVALMVMLGALGAFIALMGFGILVQNLECNCVAAGTPYWAWLVAPIAIIVAGVVVIGSVVFVTLFPQLSLARKAFIVLITAIAIEVAAFLGSSYALTSVPNRDVLIPVTVGLLLLVPAVLVVLRALDMRVRAAIR